jgi:hypothetical protein
MFLKNLLKTPLKIKIFFINFNKFNKFKKREKSKGQEKLILLSNSINSINLDQIPRKQPKIREKV